MKFLSFIKNIIKKAGFTDDLNQKIKGRVTIQEVETGNIIFKDNLVVNTSKNLIAALLSDAATTGSDNEITKIRAGTGTNPASLTDTALSSPVIGFVTKTGSTISDTKVTFSFTVDNSTWNGFLLTEFGLYNDLGSIMFSRVVTGGYYKDSSISLLITWEIDLN